MKLADMFALEELQELCESFSNLFGVATALLDLKGNILIAAGWQQACTNFHRVNAVTSKRCLESDTVLAGNLKAGHAYNAYRCKNGLVDVAVPVRIGGRHVGNLFSGQFFFEAPNYEEFGEQARKVGFDETSYLAAIRKVPVYSEERVRDMMVFLCHMAEMIGETALNNRRLKEANAELERRRLAVEDALFRVAQSEQKLLSILDNLDAYIYLKDTEGRYLFANQPVRELWNASLEDIVGHGDERFFDFQTAANIRINDRNVLDGGMTIKVEETNAVAASGVVKTFQSTKIPIRDQNGKVYALCGISVDISALKEHQRQLERAAHYDSLTQLPNRVLLADRLQQGIIHSERQHKAIAVVYLDLDHFKSVNDGFGHASGDKLLIELARRLQRCLREGDTLSRLGGDEFVAVLLDLDSHEASLPILERLRQAAAWPIEVDGVEFQVSASIGVSFFPQDEGADADLLLRQADQAMYMAKQKGRNRYHLFDSTQDRALRNRHETLERLRDALDRGEFVLYYQPKVNMRTGELVGVEALIRWQHPEKGLLPPGAFLPVIESDELIVPIGDWVIERALLQMEEWRAEDLEIPVSVNIAGRQFQAPEFLDKLRVALYIHPSVAHLLDLEIVESSALGDLAQVSKIMEACRKLGVKFSLDDFGTGYSSLTYLKRLPAHHLKIDQSFVRGMLEDSDDLAIIDGIVGLAESFGRTAIAEGVESSEHAELLLRLGCDVGQGYAIARPMPASDLPQWLLAWQKNFRPRGHPRIDRDEIELLFAMTECRAWVRAIEGALNQCSLDDSAEMETPARLLKWLDQSAERGFFGKPALERVRRLHDSLCGYAAEQLAGKARGSLGPERVPSAVARLASLRDELISVLKGVLDSGIGPLEKAIRQAAPGETGPHQMGRLSGSAR